MGTTLASWQDAETSVASFAAGTFETQSQGDGGDWAHHGVGHPASLGAEISDLAPGGTASSPTAGGSHFSTFRVRTAPDSTRSGTVRVSDLSVDGSPADALEYRVFVIDGEQTCADGAADPQTEFLIGGSDDYRPATSAVSDGTGTTIGAHATDPAELCLDLRIAAPTDGDSGAGIQGTTATVVFTIAVTQD